MKIFIDSTYHKIIDNDTDRIVFETRSPYDFQRIIEQILTEKQQIRLIEHDGIYNISKKRLQLIK